MRDICPLPSCSGEQLFVRHLQREICSGATCWTTKQEVNHWSYKFIMNMIMVTIKITTMIMWLWLRLRLRLCLMILIMIMWLWLWVWIVILIVIVMLRYCCHRVRQVRQNARLTRQQWIVPGKRCCCYFVVFVVVVVVVFVGKEML